MDKSEWTALKSRLDLEVQSRNCAEELCSERPDPLMVARNQPDEYVALACALFAYGDVNQIVRLLESFDFDVLDSSEKTIRKSFAHLYYRFQNSEDIVRFFVTLRRCKQEDSLQTIFLSGFHKRQNLFDGLNVLITFLESHADYESRGFRFLIGAPCQKPGGKGVSPYKRWMMYLRWMIRHDCLDMGLWQDSGDACPRLIIPLDTHTFRISRSLGLLTRTQYDLAAAMELTETLKRFDPDDPVRYDFALYRIGQENLLEKMTGD